jgi:AcrR family transcriptional regulator
LTNGAKWQKKCPMPRRTPPPTTNDKPVAAESVRDHLIDRTIFLMGKLGTTDVSVRTIARETGVNVAAVNYYFSSKEKMLAQMAERFQVGFDEVMCLLAGPEAPEVRLRRWAAAVMRYLAEYPGVLVLMERQMEAAPADPFGEMLRSVMQTAVRQLKATLREIVGGQDEQRLSFKFTLLASTLAGPFPRHRDSERRGFAAPAGQARFLDLLLEHLRR